MCDIWKNKIQHELTPEEYLKLPGSLREINITGGEPFLRSDIPDIIKNMKAAAPRTRLVLNTNGFMPHRIKSAMEKILVIDPKFAFRISLDGIGVVHDRIRGIRGGFDKCMQTLSIVKKLPCRDIGISFILMEQNKNELPKVLKFCRENRLQFSLTVVTNSSIYFGQDKELLRPKIDTCIRSGLKDVAASHFRSLLPKEILRGWFVNRLLSYMTTGKRALKCDAGTSFFYMDSVGNISTCHLKHWIMGNIRKQSIETILSNRHWSSCVTHCNDCWMICTAQSAMRKQLVSVASGAIYETLMNAMTRIP